MNTDSEQHEGVWDTAMEAKRWHPVLGLLKKTREAEGPEKHLALRDLVSFTMKNLGYDPWGSKAFLALALAVESSQTDPRWESLLRIILPERVK